jgi:hypothetical protein
VPLRPGRVTRLAGALLAAAILVWAATGATAVTTTPSGVAAMVNWPTPPAMAAALLLAFAVSRLRQVVVALPLAVAAAPLVADWAAGAWIFTGAGIWIAWALAIAAACRATPRLPSVAASPRAQAAAATAAAALWLAGVAAAVAPFAVTGDAPHYLVIARSLAVDGDLDLRNDYEERRYDDFYAGSLEPRHTNTSPWGEEYPFHGIGVSVLVAPAFAAFGVAGANATLIAVMAGGSGVLWLAAWHLLRHAGAAWFGWATLVCAAPFALHAAAIYPDGPAAAAVATALWLAALLHRGSAVPLVAVAAGSAGLAALPWLHARLALPAGVFGVALAWAIWRGQPERWTRLAWLLMVPIISLAGWIASALVMFDTWNPSAAILQRTAPGGWTDMARGLLGLVADHQYGLLPAAPVMAAGLWGFAAFVRAFPLVGAATGIAAAGVLVMSSAWVWWGGDAAPARFLTVVLPALALWAAHAWSTTGTGGRRVLSLALAASATMTALYAFVDSGARAYAFADGRGSVFEAFSPSVDLSLALPSLFRPGETTGLSLGLALCWLVGGTVAAAGAARLSDRRGEGRASALAAALVLAVVGVTAEAGWRIAGATPWTPGTAALTLVRDAATRGIAGIAPGTTGVRTVNEVIARVRLVTPETVPLSPPLLLYVPRVPAGVYDVRADADAGWGPLRLELGREAWPFATWPAGDAPPPVALHAAVHSVRVVGAGPPGAVWLEPRSLVSAPPHGEARRVTRYGPVTVYSMDESSHPEVNGLWTGGRRALRLLVAADAGVEAIDLAIAAGPAAVALAITAPSRQEITLAAGEQRVVRLAVPAGGAPIDLGLDVRSGFPATALGGASDSRTLGAWLTFTPAGR